MKIKLGYPDEAEEDAILMRFEQSSPLDDLQPVIEADELMQLRRLVPLGALRRVGAQVPDPYRSGDAQPRVV
jgi:MoxR-like ATPase